ncbi:MAG TPA: glycosyltransferase, partial [Verrucomicrobiae bacterium]|nr:glycosyltransferase [Verrucomicrobiae bacterium]
TWRALFPNARPIAPNRADAVTRAVAGFAPDVVYLHSLGDLAAMEAVVTSGVPVVRMVHDHSLYCLRSYKYNPLTRNVCTRAASGCCVFPCMAPLKRNRGGGLPIQWASFAKLKRGMDLTRLCERLIVYSDYSREELARNGFDRSRIHVHVPIECGGSSAPAFEGRRSNLILFAGQVIRGKGVDVLLQALARVRQPFECLIAGDGNHRAACERLCRKLRLEDRVKFLGYVPPDDLKALYASARLLAVSSVWPEPFGMVGPEAMRYGIPVVAFDVGGIPEWLLDGENGILVPWMDTRRYAAAIDRLLADESLARAMGERGRARVNRVYNSRTQVSKLEAILSELTAPRGGLNASAELCPTIEPLAESIA